MTNSRAAYRYALAILNDAEENNRIDTVSHDFEQVEKIIKQSRDFIWFLRSPVINAEKKKKILREMFEEKVSQPISDFLLFLVDKRRENILSEIIKQYHLIRDQRLSILRAVVHTAIELTPQQQQTLLDKLSRKTGKQVQLILLRDPSMIGGLTVHYDDMVLDGSIRHQLEMMARKLTAGTEN